MKSNIADVCNPTTITNPHCDFSKAINHYKYTQLYYNYHCLIHKNIKKYFSYKNDGIIKAATQHLLGANNEVSNCYQGKQHITISDVCFVHNTTQNYHLQFFSLSNLGGQAAALFTDSISFHPQK